MWFETPEDAELAETIRHLSACARPGSGPATIVAMNEWVSGSGVSPDTGEERLHFHTSFADLRDGGEARVPPASGAALPWRCSAVKRRARWRTSVRW